MPEKEQIDLGVRCVKFNKHITLLNEGLPKWRGPPEAVDVVLLSHVLIYIPDKLPVLRRCNDWLKPGGTMVVLQGHKDTIFSHICKFMLRTRITSAK